jgi:hypothetical protein
MSRNEADGAVFVVLFISWVLYGYFNGILFMNMTMTAILPRAGLERGETQLFSVKPSVLL